MTTNDEIKIAWQSRRLFSSEARKLVKRIRTILKKKPRHDVLQKKKKKRHSQLEGETIPTIIKSLVHQEFSKLYAT